MHVKLDRKRLLGLRVVAAEADARIGAKAGIKSIAKIGAKAGIKRV